MHLPVCFYFFSLSLSSFLFPRGFTCARQVFSHWTTYTTVLVWSHKDAQQTATTIKTQLHMWSNGFLRSSSQGMRDGYFNLDLCTLNMYFLFSEKSNFCYKKQRQNIKEFVLHWQTLHCTLHWEVTEGQRKVAMDQNWSVLSSSVSEQCLLQASLMD